MWLKLGIVLNTYILPFIVNKYDIYCNLVTSWPKKPVNNCVNNDGTNKLIGRAKNIDQTHEKIVRLGELKTSQLFWEGTVLIFWLPLALSWS